MARAVFPGIPHHVTQRGVRGIDVFQKTEDYDLYLQLVSEFCGKIGTEVWAYCLMTNHVHLIMVPESEDGLRAALGEAHRRYTRYVNFHEGCRGHLWQERFHSFAMDEYYLLSAVRYVEMNPVHAGMTRQAEEYPWSSARAQLAGRDDGLVKVQPMLDRVSNWLEYLDSGLNEGLVKALQQHSRTGRPLEDDLFLDMLERKMGKKLRPGRPGRKRKA